MEGRNLCIRKDHIEPSTALQISRRKGGPVFPYRPGSASPFPRHQKPNLWGDVGAELSRSWGSHERTRMRFAIVTHSQTSSGNTALSVSSHVIVNNNEDGPDLVIPCRKRSGMVQSGQHLRSYRSPAPLLSLAVFHPPCR